MMHFQCVSFLKKPTIQPVKSFPFDSGAFHHDRMEKYFFNTKLTLDDFDFSGNNDYIYRVINHFFENNAAYYDEKNKSAVPDGFRQSRAI
ncbi:hypothetical protein [Flavobacterium phycosphaerae]|uniref:hypothetical protein n=1 Tax=Flavobacterium phycosphaerae TaxID=2697515 RepID=UPI00138A30D1|nr:hypothetical protein [Flavobacterium phycosphaerae]